MNMDMRNLLVAIALMSSISACNKDTNSVWEFDAGQHVISASMLDDDKLVAVLTENEIQIINATTGNVFKRIASGDYGYYSHGRSDLHSIACAKSTCWIVGGSHYVGFLSKINIANDEKNFIESDMFSEVLDVDIGSANTVITGHGTELLTVWNAESMQPVSKLQLPLSNEIYAVHYDGQNFIAGNDAGELVIWDGKTKIPTHRFIVEPGDERSSIDSIATANGFYIVGGYEFLDLINSKDVSDKRHFEFNGASVSSCDASTESQVIWCGLTNGTLVSVGLDGKIQSSEKFADRGIIFIKTLPGIVISADTGGTVKARSVSPSSK